jgi:hypothetical protein
MLDLYSNKGNLTGPVICYIIAPMIYIIHTSSSVRRLLFFSILKCEGVSPVIFLN